MEEKFTTEQNVPIVVVTKRYVDLDAEGVPTGQLLRFVGLGVGRDGCDLTVPEAVRLCQALVKAIGESA